MSPACDPFAASSVLHGMSKKLALLIPFALACSTSGGNGQPAASGQQPMGLGGLVAQAQTPNPAEQPEPAEPPEADAPMPFEQGDAPAEAPAVAQAPASSGGLCATLCDRVAACKIATREACMPACAPQLPQLTPEQAAQVTAAMGDLSCEEVAGFAAQAGGQAGAAGPGGQEGADSEEGSEE